MNKAKLLNILRFISLRLDDVSHQLDRDTVWDLYRLTHTDGAFSLEENIRSSIFFVNERISLLEKELRTR